MRTAVLLLLLCGSAALAPGQQQSTAATLRSNTTLVLVPALVSEPEGGMAYTLTADDFRLTDNGVPQHLALEDTQAQPLALVVLMQTGGAAATQFAAYRHLDTMLRALADSNPVRIAVVDFDSQPELISPFSADLDSLPDELTQPVAVPHDSGAAIYDSVAYSLDLLKRQPASMRRAILLISQPNDVGSTTHREDLIRSIGETNTAIYSLTFSPVKQHLKNAFTLKENTPGNKPISVGACNNCVAYFDLGAPLKLALEGMQRNAADEVATLSGGEAMGFEGRHSLEDAFDKLNKHISNRYTLSFRPTSPSAGFHVLQVSLPHHPSLTVQARSNYWLTDK